MHFLLYRHCAPSADLARTVCGFYELCSAPELRHDSPAGGLPAARSAGAGASAAPPGPGDDPGTLLDADDPSLERLLPNGDANLLFDLGAPGSFSSSLRPRGAGGVAMAIGVMDSAAPARFGQGLHLLGVAFQVGRSFPLLPIAPTAIAGRALPLADLWGRSAQRLVGTLGTQRSFASRVRAIEGALLARLPDRAQEGHEIDAVVADIVRARGDVRVASLAATAGLSRQRFTRWFNERVGLAPKRFARITRAAALLREVRRGSTAWADLAPALGFYDQAHMISDFRWFVGTTPARFTRRAGPAPSVPVAADAR